MGRRVQYKGIDAALKGAATFKKGAASAAPLQEDPGNCPAAPHCLDYSAVGNNNSFPSGSKILIAS